MQVYIVTGGGWDGGWDNPTQSELGQSASPRLSSTEVMAAGSSQWQYAGELPAPTYGLKGVNIGGNFYISGGQIFWSDPDHSRHSDMGS